MFYFPNSNYQQNFPQYPQNYPQYQQNNFNDLMDTMQATAPRVYYSVMQKVKEI